MFRHQSYIILFILACSALLATMQPIYDMLYFDSLRVSQGQLWRPFTAWFVQANVEHWLINLWGLFVMAIVLPKALRKADIIGLCVIWFFSSLLLWRSDYQAYVGLSGVLYGLLVWSIAWSPYYPRGIKALVLAVIIAKVAIENSSLPWFKEAWLAQWIDGDIAHESHAWGAISGLVVVLGYWLIQRWSSNGVHRG